MLQVYEENCLRVENLRHDLLCASVKVGNAAAWDQAIDIQSRAARLLNIYVPTKADQIAALGEQYKSHFGDMNDPEVIKKIEQTTEALLKRVEKQ